jgi:hypothetical protein
MKQTIAALFGVIAMACASDYPSSVPDDLAKFKERNQVKNEVVLNVQEISNALHFVIDDKEISFEDKDLNVINVFTPGAKVVIDRGVGQTPVSRVFTSKKDPSILIVKDTNGKLVSATKTDKITGKSTEVNLISKGGNAYATVTSDDLDNEMLALPTTGDVMPPGVARRLRGFQVHDFVDASEYLAIDHDHRSLQTGCDSFDVIEVALVIDSSLCAYAGGSSDVNALSQSIIATASTFYEVPGLCKKLEISSLEIHCDPLTDPIQPFLSLAGNNAVCAESNGLLRSFAGYISSEGINADVVHLFHGHDFTGTNLIGCAYIGSLCDTGGYNAGVNDISYSGSLSILSKLVAHETGHICSAEHMSDSSDVMYKNICNSCNNAFGQTSKDSINSKVASTSCTSVENANPASVPTLVPTPVTCKDDPSFRIQVKRREEDCNYVAGLSNRLIARFCRDSIVEDYCRETCGKCP